MKPLRTQPTELEEFFPVKVRKALPQIHYYKKERYEQALCIARWVSSDTRESWYPLECSLDEYGLDICFGYRQHPTNPELDRFGWWSVEDLYSWLGGEEGTLLFDANWEPISVTKLLR